MMFDMLRGPAARSVVVVSARCAAQRCASAVVEGVERGLEVLAADVVEVHVDAVGCRGRELLA